MKKKSAVFLYVEYLGENFPRNSGEFLLLWIKHVGTEMIRALMT